VNGEVVGYTTFNPQHGRVSYPWCKPGGYGTAAEPLFEAVLAAMKERGIPKAFAAYRDDWPGPAAFFPAHGFAKVRDVANYVVDLVQLPTTIGRSSHPIERLEPADVPAIAEMGEGVIRVGPAELEKHLFANPHFPAESVFVMRQKADGRAIAAGILIEQDAYADPHFVDALMPCFRLGAFGTEGLDAKRVNGLFSFLVRDPKATLAVGVVLMGHAAYRLGAGDAGALAAQCPSDAPHLYGFYERYFQRQGGFPVYERML
jgi:hypothetical protein